MYLGTRNIQAQEMLQALQLVQSYQDHLLKHSFKKHCVLRTYVPDTGLRVGMPQTKIPAYMKLHSSGGGGQSREINIIWTM